MASHLSKSKLTLHHITVFLLFLLLVSCQSNQQVTYVTEKLIMIDSSYIPTIEKRFQYEKIDTPNSYMGGLSPKHPIAEVYSFDVKEESMWMSKGMMPAWYSLVMKVKDSLVLINSERKFKEAFAPVETEQEAISYVAYLTQTYPKYNIRKKLRYRVYSSPFPSTYAKKVNGGFEVLLHDKKVFGCGPHPYFYKIFKVTEAGEITLLQNVKMYEDPEEDASCVD